jgi:hypothetical protein
LIYTTKYNWPHDITNISFKEYKDNLGDEGDAKSSAVQKEISRINDLVQRFQA